MNSILGRTRRVRWLALLGLALAALTLRPALAVDDDVTPRLLSATLESAGPLSPGDTARITFAAEDDASPGSTGLYSQAFARFTTPVDGYVDLEATVTNGQLSSTLELVISPFMVPGAYTLQYVEITDEGFNSVSCNEDGLSGWSTDGVVADDPCPDTLSLDFTIANAGGGDTDAPVLDAQPLIPTDTYEPGSSTSVNYSASDATSGVTRVTLLFNRVGGPNYYLVGIKTGVAAGTGPVSVGIYPDTPGGQYYLDQVRLVDGAGYEVTYFADGTVMKYPSGITGPTTHSFDFNQGFTVNSPGTMDSIYPRTIRSDDAPLTFTLYVHGQNFNAESTVSVDNIIVPTTFVSTTMLTAQVPQSIIYARPPGNNYGVRLTYGDIPPGVPDLAILEGTVGSTADIDDDGCVTAVDAIEMLRSLAGLPPLTSSPPPCNDPLFAPRALIPDLDADRSGAINVGDAVHITRVVAGLVPQ